MLNLDVITKDPGIGRKLLIGSLLAFTGLGMILVVGWMVEVMRRNLTEDAPFWPEWDDFGKYAIDGLKVAGWGLVWSLPLVVVVIGTTVLGIFGSSQMDPEQAGAILLVVYLCVLGLVFPFIIVMLLLSGPAMGVLAETGSLKEMLKPAETFRVFRANAGGFVIAGLLSTVVNMALGSVGALLCMIGIYPAFVVSYGVQGQLFGKAYRDAKGKLANTNFGTNDLSQST